MFNCFVKTPALHSNRGLRPRINGAASNIKTIRDLLRSPRRMLLLGATPDTITKNISLRGRFSRINESSAHLLCTLACCFKCSIVKRESRAQVHQVSLAAHTAQALFNRRAIVWKSGYHSFRGFDRCRHCFPLCLPLSAFGLGPGLLSSNPSSADSGISQ